MNYIKASNPNPTYFDGLGVAVDHRLVYTDPDTTLAKNVYNLAGVSQGNKIALGVEGYTDPQLQLAEGDYSVMLQRYVSGDRNLDTNWSDVWPHAYILTGASATGASIGTLSILPNRAALKALPTDHALTNVLTLGYYNIGDGGGGLWYWDATSVTDDDLGYTVELDEAPGIGRFVWVRTVGQTHVSTASYGILHDIVGTCDTRFLNATTVAQANYLPMQLSNFVHTLSANFSCSNDITIPALCYFNAATGVKTVTLTGKITVETRSQSLALNKLNKTNIVFGAGSVEGARPEWWDRGYTTGTFAYQHTVDAATYGGGTVLFTRSCVYEIGNASNTYSANFVREPDATLLITTYNIVIDGAIEVQGTPYSQVFSPVTGGTLSITSKHTAPVEAWWFGWGSLCSQSQQSLLNLGYQACTTYNHIYHITKNPLGTGFIDSDFTWTDTGVTLDIDDALTITTGGSLTVLNIPTERRKIFAFDGTATGANLILKTGVIYPEWLGAFGNGISNDTTALENTFVCAGASGATMTYMWIDLGGKIYNCSIPTIDSLSYVGVRNGYVKNMMNITNSSNIRLENITVESFDGGAGTGLYIGGSTYIYIDDCLLFEKGTSTTSKALTISVGSNIYVRNTMITHNNGASFPMTIYSNSSSMLFENCTFSWSNGSTFGLSATDIQFANCKFLAIAGSASIYADYSPAEANVGTYIRYNNCQFTGCRVYISGINNIGFNRNILIGPVTATQIVLQPRSTAEPLGTDISDNMIYWSGAPVTEAYHVAYATTFGAYIQPTNSLFGSFRVANNVSNVAGNQQAYYNEQTATMAGVRSRAWKTHGTARTLISGASTDWSIYDDYLGSICAMWVSKSIGTNIGDDRLVHPYAELAMTAGAPRLHVDQVPNGAIWTFNFRFATSSRM